MTYEDAIRTARDLFELGDPFESYAEYARGVCNILAELYPVVERPVGERMTDIARAIGLPVSYD